MKRRRAASPWSRAKIVRATPSIWRSLRRIRCSAQPSRVVCGCARQSRELLPDHRRGELRARACGRQRRRQAERKRAEHSGGGRPRAVIGQPGHGTSPMLEGRADIARRRPGAARRRPRAVLPAAERPR